MFGRGRKVRFRRQRLRVQARVLPLFDGGGGKSGAHLTMEIPRVRLLSGWWSLNRSISDIRSLANEWLTLTFFHKSSTRSSPVCSSIHPHQVASTSVLPRPRRVLSSSWKSVVVGAVDGGGFWIPMRLIKGTTPIYIQKWSERMRSEGKRMYEAYSARPTHSAPGDPRQERGTNRGTIARQSQSKSFTRFIPLPSRGWIQWYKGCCVWWVVAGEAVLAVGGQGAGRRSHMCHNVWVADNDIL